MGEKTMAEPEIIVHNPGLQENEMGTLHYNLYNTNIHEKIAMEKQQKKSSLEKGVGLFHKEI